MNRLVPVNVFADTRTANWFKEQYKEQSFGNSHDFFLFDRTCQTEKLP